ncbi:hypothetical protein L1887_21215 [Cichorium endivia]|nr:hypothetical protein L1887_21215 [Cichorium endivia]
MWQLANTNQLSCRCRRVRRAVASRALYRVGCHSSHQGDMWRSTSFPENENSDQSISEDDDSNGDVPQYHVSLGIPAEEKGKVQILSQLDMLRDANEVMHERHQTSLLQKRQPDMWVEDDVEFPYFANKSKFTYNPQGASACNSDEEILSDNEVGGNCMQSSKYLTSEGDNCHKIEPSGFSGDIRDGICTWLAANVNTEADADSASFHPVSARAKRSFTVPGGQGKAKHKFSFRTQLHNDTLFQDEHAVKYNKTKSTSEQLADKRSILSIDHDYIEDDHPDCLSSDSSEEDEDNHQIQGLTVAVPKQKTIADQFHEVLGANEEGNMYAVSRHTGFGLFGKLQRVIHREKERDLYFLSKLQKEDEASCFDVRILSKSLEGKLTVCSCSSIKNVTERKNFIIIFSSRTCSDVELDVGMLVRVHPPWKEVNVKGKQENTILSTYFSQI